MSEHTETEQVVVDCLECGDRITVTGRVKMGQVVTCPECRTKMEVVDLHPFEIDWAYDEPEYKVEREGW